MELSTDDLIKVLLAVLVGGLIGAEREFRDKAAGFRTLMFICLGSALFTIFSVKLAAFGDSRLGGSGDATRIASNIVAGVGFLGAGVILRHGGKVIGLTTAAAVWLVAALGMGIGAGEHALVLAVTAVTLLILGLFPLLERWIDDLNEERLYRITCALAADKLPALRALFEEHGLRVAHCHPAKHGARVVYRCKLSGRLERHDRLIERLLADPEIDDLRF